MTASELLQDALEEGAELVGEAIRQGEDVNAIWEDQTFLSAAAQIGEIDAGAARRRGRSAARSIDDTLDSSLNPGRRSLSDRSSE